MYLFIYQLNFNLNRFDIKHRMMYCENYKIGSSTWAIHLLKMNKIPIYRRTPIHIVTRKSFPPLFGAKKKKFLERATRLIIARDPFERLLSSFKVNPGNYFKNSKVFNSG